MRAGPEGMGPGLAEMFSTIQQKVLPRKRKLPTGQASECFFKVGTTTKPNRNQPNSQSEKLSFFPKVYSRKQSASPSYLNGYCCLRTAGYARQLPGIQSRTFNTAHWSHIPQNQGRRGSTGSGDCRVDYKGVSPILTIMTPTKLVFSIKYSRREVFNKLCCSGFSKT